MEHFRIKNGFQLYDASSCFSAILQKGNNFSDILFDALDNQACHRMVNSLIKEFALFGANSFLQELSPFRKEANDNNRVASPESIPFQFKRSGHDLPSLFLRSLDMASSKFGPNTT